MSISSLPVRLAYLSGGHSMRHIVGGCVDQLSRAPLGRRAHSSVSCLNSRHMVWAWTSLFTVGLTARGESPAAFDGRCIPAGRVAPSSNIPDILGRRALPGVPSVAATLGAPAGRLARLGATLAFHHGLLSDLHVRLCSMGVWSDIRIF